MFFEQTIKQIIERFTQSIWDISSAETRAAFLSIVILIFIHDFFASLPF